MKTEKEINILEPSPKLIVADFWATWCGPCRALAPVISQLAGEVTEDVEVVKINIDNTVELAETLKITSIPTVLFIKNGEVVDKVVGFPKSPLVTLRNKIAQWK